MLGVQSGEEERRNDGERGVREEHAVPIKRLDGKVDQLQDEVSSLVKMLARKRLARRTGAEGYEGAGEEHRSHDDVEGQGLGRNSAAREDGDVSPRDAGDRPAEAHGYGGRSRADSRSVFDWMRGATRAARI